jgi:hypothetical protein
MSTNNGTTDPADQVIDLLTDVLMATSKSRHDFWTFTFTGVSNDHM